MDRKKEASSRECIDMIVSVGIIGGRARSWPKKSLIIVAQQAMVYLKAEDVQEN
jgi:hypothetical protein